MNRLILRYGYPITAVILAIFAWVVYQRASGGWPAIVPLAIAAVIVWVLATPTLIYLWPRLTIGGFKRAIVGRGFGGGPIPVNTLYAEPALSSAAGPNASLLGTGTDDVLYVAGWVELEDAPQVLHVPDMSGRYYSIQFTDPVSGANFAYVGTRTTGSAAGDYVLVSPGRAIDIPGGMSTVRSPHHSALVIGRVFVADEADRAAAYALARQLQLRPLLR